MTREEYIKILISDRGYNVKSFANYIDLPYSTLRSILSSGVGGAAVDNVIKICRGLGITIDTLNRCGIEDSGTIALSAKERELIFAYRSQPSLRLAVDRTLGISSVGSDNENKKRA